MNMSYKNYTYPLNLLRDICGTDRLPNIRAEELQAVLEQLLTTLPEWERQALSLRYVQQLTFDHIGAQMGISGVRAGQLVSKGLRMLRHPTRYKRLIAPGSQKANEVDACPLSPDFPIGGMGLSINPYNCLLRHGVVTVADILRLTREDLLSIRGMGKKSYDEVIEKLAALGYDVSPYML